MHQLLFVEMCLRVCVQLGLWLDTQLTINSGSFPTFIPSSLHFLEASINPRDSHKRLPYCKFTPRWVKLMLSCSYEIVPPVICASYSNWRSPTYRLYIKTWNPLCVLCAPVCGMQAVTFLRLRWLPGNLTVMTRVLDVSQLNRRQKRRQCVH